MRKNEPTTPIIQRRFASTIRKDTPGRVLGETYRIAIELGTIGLVQHNQKRWPNAERIGDQ